MPNNAKLDDLYSAVARSGSPRWEALSDELGADADVEIVPDPAQVTFNFDQGLPAPETIPVSDLARLTSEVSASAGPMGYEYFDPSVGYEELVYGYRGLRSAIAERIQRIDGRDIGADGIMLTSGSTQAIALTVHAFLEPGDGLIVENVTFPYTVKYAQNLGARVAYADVDVDGCDPDSVEARLRELQASGSRPKLVYISGPTFQTPTGMTMPLDRRKRLIEIVQKWGVVLLEDGVYRDLRYEGDPLPTLLSLDDSGLVLMADSFSKTVAPALRLGWLAGRADIVETISATREDLGVSQVTARVMERFLRDGLYEPHVARACDVLRRKRDIAVDAVREHVGDAVSYTVPHGSLYLWLRLADGIDWAAVQRNAFQAGVYCRPGERFSDDPSFQQFVRLQYSMAPIEDIQRGIEIFGQAIAAARSGSESPVGS
jgi:2-aminoadipate transaminase